MDGEQVRAPGRVGERECDGHLAAHGRMGGLELHHLDHMLIRHEPHEVAMVRVRVRAGLASAARLVVAERRS
jgi:hypothetical protein